MRNQFLSHTRHISNPQIAMCDKCLSYQKTQNTTFSSFQKDQSFTFLLCALKIP